MSMSRILLSVTAFLSAFVFTACTANAADMPREEIEQIVQEYILENPEIIREAIYLLQQQAENEKAQQAAEALSGLQDSLNNNVLDPVGGNPDGSITLVEFFDYNCGYCKRVNSVVKALIKENPNLKVVYKEWPILSEASSYAARVALAVNIAAPEQYEELHRAFLSASSLRSEGDIWKVVAKVGIDRSLVESAMSAPEIDQHLEETAMLARQLDITGTPAFVVGDQILKGAYPQEQIQRAIDSQS